MSKLAKPIFYSHLNNISWIKIYAREYGVQYSEMAVLCLSPKATYHIPSPSVNQVIIPEENKRDLKEIPKDQFCISEYLHRQPPA